MKLNETIFNPPKRKQPVLVSILTLLSSVVSFTSWLLLLLTEIMCIVMLVVIAYKLYRHNPVYLSDVVVALFMLLSYYVCDFTRRKEG